jgi:hypothetical protein
MKKAVLVGLLLFFLLGASVSVTQACNGGKCVIYYNYTSQTLSVLMIEPGFWTFCSSDPMRMQPDQIAMLPSGQYDIALEQYKLAGGMDVRYFQTAMPLPVDVEVAPLKSRNFNIVMFGAFDNFAPRDRFNFKARRKVDQQYAYFAIDPNFYPGSFGCELVNVYKDCSDSNGCAFVADP